MGIFFPTICDDSQKSRRKYVIVKAKSGTVPLPGNHHNQPDMEKENHLPKDLKGGASCSFQGGFS